MVPSNWCSGSYVLVWLEYSNKSWEVNKGKRQNLQINEQNEKELIQKTYFIVMTSKLRRRMKKARWKEIGKIVQAVEKFFHNSKEILLTEKFLGKINMEMN